MATHQLITYKNRRWYHFDHGITEPDQKFLNEHFHFPPEVLESCADKKTQRPKVKINKKYVYLILHFPYQVENSTVLSIAELNVFITKSSLITIESQGHLPALKEFFATTKLDQKTTRLRFKSSTSALFTRLISAIIQQLTIRIDQQGEEIDRLHQEIFEKRLAKRFIGATSRIRYNQIIVHNALERQNRILDQYRNERCPLLILDKGSHFFWHKILDQLLNLQHELESDMDHLEGLVKTFESLITFHTNETIKVLTIFSVLLLPLTLLSGIYGMNFIHLPLSTHPFGFFAIIAGMSLIALSMVVFFRMKRWL